MSTFLNYPWQSEGFVQRNERGQKIKIDNGRAEPSGLICHGSRGERDIFSFGNAGNETKD